MGKRLKDWGVATWNRVRFRKWWLVIIPLAANFTRDLFQDRLIGFTNGFIDNHLPSWERIRPVAMYLLSNPIAVMFIVFLFMIAILVVHAYMETRPNKGVEIPENQGSTSAVIAGFDATFEATVERLIPATDRDPRITIEFDGGDSMKASGITGKRMFLRNKGGTDAFQVQAHDIRLGAGTATFKVIPQIAAIDGRQEVQISISGDTRDLVCLFLKQVSFRPDSGDWSEQEEVLRIRYSDHARAEFGTNVALSCNLFTQEITAKNYVFGKVIRDQ